VSNKHQHKPKHFNYLYIFTEIISYIIRWLVYSGLSLVGTMVETMELSMHLTTAVAVKISMRLISKLVQILPMEIIALATITMELKKHSTTHLEELRNLERPRSTLEPGLEIKWGFRDVHIYI
ncbi:hypothetical protein KIW84_072319, partial [Lathyrus oleraceus]